MSESERPPVVTVGALIVDPAGRVLVVRTHKWRDTWGVPGGKIARGEPMVDALVREIREETGLAIRDVRFVAALEAIDSPEFHKPSHMILLNFVARSDGGAVALNDEAEEYRWVAPDDALALPLNSFTRTLVEAARTMGAIA
jgi:ADP-ribose pyrophosphatase YjhB (NUDIX family)